MTFKGKKQKTRIHSNYYDDLSTAKQCVDDGKVFNLTSPSMEEKIFKCKVDTL